MTILKFPNAKRGVEDVLSDASHLATVITVGVDGDGIFHFDYSGDDLAHVYMLLGQAMRESLDMAVEE